MIAPRLHDADIALGDGFERCFGVCDRSGEGILSTPCLALLCFLFGCIVCATLLIAHGRRGWEERGIGDGGLPVVMARRRAGRRGVFVMAWEMSVICLHWNSVPRCVFRRLSERTWWRAGRCSVSGLRGRRSWGRSIFIRHLG